MVTTELFHGQLKPKLPQKIALKLLWKGQQNARWQPDPTEQLGRFQTLQLTIAPKRLWTGGQWNTLGPKIPRMWLIHGQDNSKHISNCFKKLPKRFIRARQRLLNRCPGTDHNSTFWPSNQLKPVWFQTKRLEMAFLWALRGRDVDRATIISYQIKIILSFSENKSIPLG